MTAVAAPTARDEDVAAAIDGEDVGGSESVDAVPLKQPRDAGVSAVEVVFLTPIMMLMVMMIVGLGVLVNTSGVVDGAARDAARAGSLQGDTKTAGPASTQAALDAARADLQNRCTGTGGLADTDIVTKYIPPGPAPAPAVALHTPVAYFKVTITCRLDMTVFSMFNMFGTEKTVTASFLAPVNTYQGVTSGTGVGS